MINAMDLRPLSYEEICQVELLHAAASAAAANNKTSAVSSGSVSSGTSAAAPQTKATMLPIMVIPTSMMPPGTIIAASNNSGCIGTSSGGAGGVGISSIDGSLCEHQFYQLQPTHILATSANSSSHAMHSGSLVVESGGVGIGVGGIDMGMGMGIGNQTAIATQTDEQHPHQQQQQIPQTIMGTTQSSAAPSSPATVNVLYAGTINNKQPSGQTEKSTATATSTSISTSTLTSLLTRKALEAATLPRGFVTSAYFPGNTTTSDDVDGNPNSGVEENDFEGSECGASLSTTACIPPFRFGGCGMILQPTAMHHHHHQQQHPHQRQHQQHLHESASASAPSPAHTPTPAPVIGCGAFTHMMGSFAAAASGAMHSGRLAGVGAGLTNTLGRHRRGTSTTSSDGTTQTPKRVSFKGDTMPPLPAAPPPPSLPFPPPLMDEHLHQQLHELDPTGMGMNMGVGLPMGMGMGMGIGMGMGLKHHSQMMTSTPTPPPPPTVDAFNSCSYVHFDNFMDYQTTGFGGLPDVTEHSNMRRTLSRQNSISNSDSGGEIASIQKSKVNFGDQIKSPTSSGGAGAGDAGIGVVGGGSSAAARRRKSKAAQQGDTGAIVQVYKTRRGSFAIALTLVAALCLLAIAALLAYQHFFMAPSRNSQTQRLRIVRRILREVPLVDGHNNFAWNVRKYAHSSLELVHVQHDLDQKTLWTRPSWAQTDMERLKLGLVGVQVWSAYVPCEAQGLDAVQLALEQIDIIRRLADMYATETTLVTSSQDITAARRRGLMASLIGIEGGHAIGSSLGVLRSFYSLGARYLSLTHRCDVSWASSSVSSVETHGLTQFGKAIVREMNRLGMMIDLSYSSDATARDVLQLTRAPVIFSHSAARQLCNSTRNIPDDILRLVADNGGLIMVSFDSEDVACSSGRQARLKDVIDHIKYIRSIAGIQHIGIGAGYDGIDMPPIGLEDVSKYPDLLAALLEDSNWSEEDIAMLAGKNFLRIMDAVENVRDYWKRAAIQPIEQTEPQPKSQCTYMSS